MYGPHATEADVEQALSPAVFDQVDVEDLPRLLLRASELIDDVTSRAVYAVDDNGNAEDPDIAEALALATSLVVELFVEVGEENAVDGLAGRQISVTGFSGERAPEITRRIMRPLRAAGLLCQPGVVGTVVA